MSDEKVYKGRIYPCMFQHLTCDVFLCYTSATWWVGDPHGPEGLTFKLCDGCAKAMLADLPAELSIPEEAKPLVWQETAAPIKRRASKATVESVTAQLVDEEEETGK